MAATELIDKIDGAIDTHCHLDIVAGRDIAVEQSLQNAGQEGVQAILQIATNLDSSRWNRDLIAAHQQNLQRSGEQTQPQLFWTAGLHPEAADKLEQLPELFELIRKHRNDAEFWGIGETGLDYFHTMEYVPQQKDSFAQHLDLAQELQLPIVLHTRDDRSYNPDRVGSVRDSLEMVRARKGVRGVCHCFTYTDKEARDFVDLGWFISYSGVLTFNNAKVVQEGACQLPLDALLVETDAPFLAPVPQRGKPNQPAYVVHTLDFLVKLRSEKCGEDPELVRQTILENSKRFLSLKHF